MFDGRQYKKQALAQLKGHWATPVLIQLITFAVSAAIALPNVISQVISQSGDFSAAGLFSSLAANAVAAILEIALCKYFLILREAPEKATFSAFLESFNLWARGLLGTLWMSLWIFLWFWVLMIPAFVKMVAYSQTLFILAEYPSVSVRKALKISMAITKGYKADLFLLELSFIGWALLSVLTAYIGLLWLCPYMQTTLVNAYQYLKADALRRGVITREDLGLPPEAETAAPEGIQ